MLAREGYRSVITFTVLRLRDQMFTQTAKTSKVNRTEDADGYRRTASEASGLPFVPEVIPWNLSSRWSDPIIVKSAFRLPWLPAPQSIGCRCRGIDRAFPSSKVTRKLSPGRIQSCRNETPEETSRRVIFTYTLSIRSRKVLELLLPASVR